MTESAEPRRPSLTLVRVGADPQAWVSAGFSVTGHTMAVGGVTVEFTAPLGGIEALGFDWLPDGADNLDGLPLEIYGQSVTETHENGVYAMDQVVIATPDFDRTASAMRNLGLGLKREVIREDETGNQIRQGFVRSGDAILELVNTASVPEGHAHGWGLGFITADLDAAVTTLEGMIGPPHDAIQPGRHIAVFHRDAQLGIPTILMDPEPEAQQG